MAIEIERKYLVANDSFRSLAIKAITIWQGYLSTDPDATVRLRIADDRAYITIKSRNKGAARGEWEYEIPLADALAMKPLCKATLAKVRHIVPDGGHVWEVDEFGGRHSGLALAEIELRSEDEHFDLPPFVGDEVTGDPKYYNSNLSKV